VRRWTTDITFEYRGQVLATHVEVRRLGPCGWPGHLYCRRRPGEWEGNGASHDACNSVKLTADVGSRHIVFCRKSLLTDASLQQQGDAEHPGLQPAY